MVQFSFTYDPKVSLEQRIGFEMAAAMWSSLLSDDASINLHVVATDGLDNNKAVGGAVPLFHEVHYGVYQEYLAQDATSEEDQSAIASLQDTNLVDVLIDGSVIDDNRTVTLTSAQAKALGMTEALQLENGTEWTRDTIEANALDGYILINNNYNWNYDFTRESKAPGKTLDFLTMALHEIGHQLGFVSGLDGLLETLTEYSGNTQVEGFTALDLFRYTLESQAANNPEGALADLTHGADAYFSIDGNEVLAEFSEGQNKNRGGDGYQASHWKRFRNAIGVMDPTLGYRERTNISHLDLQAFDVLGWDINYSALEGLELDALYAQAREAVAQDFWVDADEIESAVSSGKDWYTLGYSSWWQAFEKQMIELGYSSWWQAFETDLLKLGYSSWWQAFDKDVLELGYSSWWQSFENKVVELGYSSWWQSFEGDLLELGYSSWWQKFEPEMLKLSYSSWWQTFEKQMLELGYSSWWQSLEADLLELGYSSWWQAFEDQVLELGYSSWWQLFEDKVIELGYSSWWQTFENQILELGYSSWWQAFESPVLELSYSSWWQEAGTFFATLEDKFAEDDSLTFTQLLEQNYSETGLVKGSQEDDIIGGTDSQDRIKGRAGDDLIDGAAGNDVIWGNAGHDILYGHEGMDVLYGGAGRDLLLGEEGDDHLLGGRGADILSGGRGNDVLSGDNGRDELNGGDGTDVLAGGKGDDLLRGEGQADLLMGNAGRDLIQGGDGNDLIYGDRDLATEQSGLSVLLKEFLASLEASNNNSRDETAFVPSTDVAGNVIRIEAEDMELSGYRSEALKNSWKERGIESFSGDAVIRTDQQGSAKTIFNGTTGSYVLIANYLDESDGQATVSVTINGVAIDTWQFDQDTDQMVSRTVATEVTLLPGDVIEINGSRDQNEYARIDYIDLIPLENLLPTYLEDDPSSDKSDEGSLSPVVSTLSEVDSGEVEDLHDSVSSAPAQLKTPDADMLEGGQGQDFIYGDEGDDVIYGETAGTLDYRASAANASGVFDGENAFIAGHQDSMLINQGTLAFSFHAHGTSGFQGLFSKDSGGLDEGGHFSVYIEHDNYLTARLQSTSGMYHVHSRTAIDLNKQHDVAVTFGDRGLELWLNGELVDTHSYDGGLGNNSGGSGNREPIVLGALQTYSGDLIADDVFAYFTGTLQNVRLFDQQLQSDSISQASAGNIPASANTVFEAFTVDSSNDDVLVGGQGSDKLYGNLGNDIIHGDNVTDSSSPVSTPLTFAGRPEIYSGHQYLLTDSKMTWEEAQAYAESLGGNLVTINDAAEEAWLWQTFEGSDSWWTGLNDKAVEGQFEWVSGEPVTYTHFQSGEPNNAGGIEDYVEMNYGRDRTWNDREGDDQARAVIEIDSIPRASEKVFNSSHYFLTGNEMTWEEAQAYAESLGGNLVTINDASEEAWLRETFGTEALWTGLNDEQTEGQFEWVSGESVTYTNFAPGEPNNANSHQHYVYINYRSNGQWDDEAWGRKMRGIIEVDLSDTAATYGNSRYVLTSTEMTWREAQTQAEALGGNLVTLNDADEEAWLQQTFGTESLWIGLNDEQTEGQFEWASGEAVTYTNWKPGQPNNSGTGQDYAHMNHEDLGQWDDEEITRKMRGIIEIKADVNTDGNDWLFGNSGNDVLYGEGGDDILNGTSGQAMGRYEQDKLSGGTGRDQFILGDYVGAYYISAADHDYATILDLTPGLDIIQLHGSASDYSQSQTGNHLHLFYGDSQDLIAKFENLISLNLNQDAIFV